MIKINGEGKYKIVGGSIALFLPAEAKDILPVDEVQQVEIIKQDNKIIISTGGDS
jgi:antitoxin component of MazEF toxin-antitoxin module